MDIQSKNKALYFILTTISAILVLIALGPGLIETGTNTVSWQYIFFEKLCHQDPERSYAIAGKSMAVCARCLGIYSAFAVGLISLPLFGRYFQIDKKHRIRLVIGIITLNAIDIFGNAIGIWTNTLESRLILGLLFGLSIAILLTDEFFKRNIKTEDTYGSEFAA